MHHADVVSHGHLERVAIFGDDGLDSGRHLIDQVRDGKHLEMDVHLTGFDLGEVKDVVDEV